ncbi:MAG: hypothetical protein MJA29_09740 [Candidatus Omnitrophica bacterium]|nr:hypothetical protein [Candidatus Omnitrophota bacterium]
MEKVVVLILVFACIALFIRQVVKTFRGGDGSCCGCRDAGKCRKDNA